VRTHSVKKVGNSPEKPTFRTIDFALPVDIKDRENAKMTTTTISTSIISGPRVLRPHETRRLLKLPDKRSRKGRRDAALLAVLATGGLRVGEAVRLTVGNVELVSGGRVALRFRTSKRRREEYRSVVLPPHASKLLSDWLVFAEPRLWLFSGHRGEHLSVDGAQKIVVKYLRLLGRGDLRTHGLRHSFASQIVRETGSIFVAAKLLGHASIETTSRYYASFSLDDALRASEALHEALKRRAPRGSAPAKRAA
jgi:integrase